MMAQPLQRDTPNFRSKRFLCDGELLAVMLAWNPNLGVINGREKITVTMVSAHNDYEMC